MRMVSRYFLRFWAVAARWNSSRAQFERQAAQELEHLGYQSQGLSS